MGNHLLPADTLGYADHFRADTMGILPASEMGRCMGKVDDTLLTVHFYGAMLYFVGYFYNLTHSISYRLRIYISHPQQTCTKIAIKKSNEGGARAYWQVGFEIIDVFLFRLPSHLSLVWSCFLSNICPRISSCFGLIIWHKAVMFDIFSNRR